MARWMMVQSNLAKEWWGEAIQTACATTNCLIFLSRSAISPLQQLFGKKPTTPSSTLLVAKLGFSYQIRTNSPNLISLDGTVSSLATTIIIPVIKLSKRNPLL